MKFIKTLLPGLFAVVTSGAALAQPAVIPGDYPDPSVTKVGDTYWASATTSNWFPAYPLLKSTDLVNWQTVGNIFNKVPDWADYYFWAPEITAENGKVYVYYTAHKKGGNLCVAVASADRPEGPYRDHGPLVGQSDGSIDGFPMRDETGKLYLIWKEDGNSVKQPTPIWAQPMNEERTALTGEKKELFRNTDTWEGNLVEGVSMIRHGDYFYAIYAGAGCCGTGCTYATGVARAKNLLGPWEKFSQNPILTDEGSWRCPGHGTVVEKDGRFFFLYHAYDKQTSVYTGRQALLKEFTFTADGWIKFLPATPVVAAAKPVSPRLNDSFAGKTLSHLWQWSVFKQPHFDVRKGALTLRAQPAKLGSAVAQRTLTGDYTVTTTVDRKQSAGQPGLAAIGDDDNALGISLDGSTLNVWRLERGKKTVVATQPVDPSRKLTLQLRAQQGHRFSFGYATDGKTFQTVTKEPINGAFLPPWDRAVRVGILAMGSAGEPSVFEDFVLQNTQP
ncbi:family 43 glycosylhydrolase [Rudanella paleaurantiibacter]|uniref:Family 43 glycosylhydrolase n=1 Tax=Rudanella paleaurantiibacter TaxID=2614655 RepID=A0A7J5TUW9_9BACT|nr:family 43 glycosylhydrolase [Rudanella paleaurantiibacter]KAB7727952.1 family 43 glycosylhydrolase [Rudanella paleaurantiibacter]